MSNRELADMICRLLISIVAVVRKKFDLPEYKNISIHFEEKDT